VAIRKPRKDSIEPGTEGQKIAPLNKKKTKPQGMPYASSKNRAASSAAKPLIGGRSAPGLKDGLRKMTPAEKQKTVPKRVGTAPSDPSTSAPMIGGKPAPRKGNTFKDYVAPRASKGTDRFNMTPAEKKRVKGKGGGSMTRPAPRAGGAASGNAKTSGGASKYGRR
jgi:hypothetical protein